MAPTTAPPTSPISMPPADDVYGPQICTSLFGTPGSTPGSVGSPAVLLTADPTFSTDEYEVYDVDPRSNLAKKKGKAPTGKTSDAKPKRPRSTYTAAELMLIAECWADTSEDAAYEGIQGVWHEATHHRRIRRHWERLMKECDLFNDIYRNLMEHMRSCENEYTVRTEVNKLFAGRHNTKGFKWWDIYERIKYLPKFRTGTH